MKSSLRNGLALLSGVAAVTLVACKDEPTVPPLNSTAVTVGPLDLASLATSITGVVNSVRANAGLTYYYVGASFAHDVLRFDPSESRFISEAFTSAPSRTSFFGASQFNGEYTTIRAGRTLLYNLSVTPDNVISPKQKQAARGFVQTMQALEYYRVEAYHDTLGTPIQVADSSKVGPILCPASTLKFISALLDSGNVALDSATKGTDAITTFPFPLPSGFKTNGDFTNIQAFRTLLNRGLKGEVEVYLGIGGRGTAGTQQNFATAKAALDTAIGPMPTSLSDLNRGPYFQFSTAPGELSNPLADVYVFADSQIYSPRSADNPLGAEPGDQRVTRKFIITPDSDFSKNVAGGGATRTYLTHARPAVSTPSNPANFVNPIAILRVEELVLLRAQAEIGLNQLAAATADINIVRHYSADLPAIDVPVSQAAAIDSVLYEKRLSLFFEGPQRIVDLRAYGKLSAPYVFKENPADRLNRALFIPQAEVDLRNGDVTVTCS
jgi:hypothetical protein